MFRAVFTVKLILSLSGGEPGLVSHLLEGPACWKVPLSIDGPCGSISLGEGLAFQLTLFFLSF